MPAIAQNFRRESRILVATRSSRRTDLRRRTDVTGRADRVGPPGQRYAEDHVAANWRLQAAGIDAPIVGIAFFIAGPASQLTWLEWISIVVGAAGVCTGALLGNWLFCMWPAGIRLDADGVRIGGVRWAERHPGTLRTRTAIAPRQQSQVFACPWDGVLRIGVTIDQPTLRWLRRKAGYRAGRLDAPLGELAAPFMRAALVIWVDTSRAQLPDIRAARNPLWSNFPGRGHHQPLWVVPTRHPAKLLAALAALPQSADLVADPAGIIRAAIA
jgi:hypothetical protein